MMQRVIISAARARHFEKAILLRAGGGATTAVSSRRPFSAPAHPTAGLSHGGGGDDGGDSAMPTLKRIPTLPIFGSMVPAYSGIPAFDRNNIVNYMRTIMKDHGPFFTMGFPGFGSGLHGTVYIVRDPKEMLKVLKQEGAYPSGVVESEWPLMNWMKKKHYSSVGLMARGPEWKRIRSFIQKDLLAPASAREYLPGILKGAAEASPKAAQLGNEEMDIVRFLNYSAMDMFSYVLFGGGQRMSQEDYQTFCTSAVKGMAELFNIMRSPLQIMAHKVGYTTPQQKVFMGHMDVLDSIARRTLKKFIDQVEKDDLTPEERNSYFYKLLQRQPESEVTEEEVIETAVMMLIAAVDTTAAKTSWNVLQLALNQDVQEKLYQQLNQAIQKEGGVLTATIFENSKVPLLPAFVRETHRCTPPLLADLSKEVSKDTDVYGVTIPAGSTVMFDCLTNMMDPDLVENPMEFRPERWLKEAVDARKDTNATIIDHPFYSGPFSQGARRCPGSRVAYLEVQAMIAQLLLDWKIEGPTNVHWKDIRGSLQTLLVPVYPDEVRFVPRRS